MKKTYIIPTTAIQTIMLENMVAGSPDGFNNTLGTKNVEGDAALVKENRSDYNVWDDDWSK